MATDAAVVDAFFAETAGAAPDAATEALISAFVAEQGVANRHLVVITSGGTLVPLEHNMVRFLDNFSGGRRGAASAEAFLAADCAVIFAYRRHSIEPFARTVPQGCNLLREVADGTSPALMAAAEAYAKHASRLLELTFDSVGQYMHLLRCVARATQPLGERCMIFLAAAVSDFYVPAAEMAQHKIQSSAHGELHLRLQPVPKVLGMLCDEWCPKAYVVSFKLETDPEILERKATGSLARYGHHAVIANILATRHQEVVLYPGGETVRAPDGGGDLEPKLILTVLARWETWAASVAENKA